MEHTSDVKKVLITKEQLAERIKELGKQITKDYSSKRPLMVAMLKGAFMFYADLVREIDLDVDIDFMVVSSYGAGTVSSGHVVIKQDMVNDCCGRDVIIVEDIVDTGITMQLVKQVLLDRGVKSFNIATLLSKKARRKTEVETKYVGFEIPDEFVIGYGMDFDEKYRTLRDVCVLREEAYEN